MLFQIEYFNNEKQKTQILGLSYLKKIFFLDDRNMAKAPFQYLSSLGNKPLSHINLHFRFCKVLVSLALSPVKTHVPPTKRLAIMSSLKTSVKIFK